MESSKFEGWYIVEQMGHKRLSGYVQEATIVGHGFLRVDVFGEAAEAKATQFIEPGTVYCLTPVSEEAARAVGKRLTPEPVVLQLLQRKYVGDDEDFDEVEEG